MAKRNTEQEIDDLKAQVDSLHTTLEGKGINSRGTTDIQGRLFNVPVDEEHKAKSLPLGKFTGPHMHAFHASWLGFFATFFSTFAPAPLAPTLMKPTTLNLKRSDIQSGNLAAVSTNIICRFLMGIVCDKMGPRRGMAFLLLITSPAIVGIAFVNGAGGFIICRAIIGMSLASFVACQVWCSQMFSKSVVGTANATAGGWGNLGGGIAPLLIGVIYRALASGGIQEDTAWRLCMILPFALHMLGATACLTGRDLPDGNYAELESLGAKQQGNAGIVAKIGVSNVNAWIMTFVYALSFGVELTMVNIATQYFYEYHGLTQFMAAIFAGIFGMINIFARSLGGIASDKAAAKFGMRGRIWALWFFQTLEGVLALVMGLVTLGMSAPDFTTPANMVGYVQITDQFVPVGGGVVTTRSNWVAFDGANITERIRACGTNQVEIKPSHFADGLDARFQGMSTVVLTQPPSMGGADCVCNSGTSVVVVIIMILFSICVQMSEGLAFGVVPSISRPALGVVSGMVGAGGNAGALMTNAFFFLSDAVRTDTGFLNMGIFIIVGTATCAGIYFPEHGGMFFKAGSLKYDPQLIKPPKDYKGADEIATKPVEKPVHSTPSTADATNEAI